MRFHFLPIDQAGGRILAHNVSDETGRRVLRKGQVVGDREIELLRSTRRSIVQVVELESGDVEEDRAAGRLAEALIGCGVGRSPARTGRVNFSALERGVVRIDRGGLEALNRVQGVALATVREHTPAPTGGVIASLKIVPYALAADAMREALAIARDSPVLSLSALRRRRVGLLLSGSPGARNRLLSGFAVALARRVEGLGSVIEPVRYVLCGAGEDEEAGLARAIEGMIDVGVEVLLMAGETAIVDRDDVAPRAMRRAGAELAAYGAPVDPGNLVALGYLRSVPILGLPGCARSQKPNVVDLLLPRLLVGERLDAGDLARLGHGGLLDDVPERGLPRSWVV